MHGMGKHIMPLFHIYSSYLVGKEAQMYKAKISSLPYININMYTNINITIQNVNESYIYSRSREYKQLLNKASAQHFILIYIILCQRDHQVI